jgi:hypothetical protein
VKDNFDWVEARARCSVRNLFDDLRKIVEANVRSACTHVAPDIVVDDPVPGRFVVRVPFAGRPDLKGLWRAFDLCDEDSAIRVFGPSSTPFFVARAHLDDERCRLEVERCIESSSAQSVLPVQPMGLADFSRLVLEPIFFRGR